MKNCSMPYPYPPIKVREKNRRYAQILANLYAGRYSELTAISGYIYQSIITDEKVPDASDTFECIAVCEMRHFDMLGKLILLLGDDPKLCVRVGRNRNRYWSGDYVDGETDPYRMIKNDIRAEEEAIADYSKSIELINDEFIKEILERIIIDEKHHIVLLGSLIKQV